MPILGQIQRPDSYTRKKVFSLYSMLQRYVVDKFLTFSTLIYVALRCHSLVYSPYKQAVLSFPIQLEASIVA